MGSYKIKCHICKTTNKGEHQPTICSVCSADLINPSIENIQKKVGCAFFSGGQYGTFGESGWNGDLYLTNKRLFFIKIARIQIEAGLLNNAIADPTNNDKDSFNLVSSNIKAFEIEESGKRGVNDKYRITTDGGEIIRFSIPAKYFMEWKLAIENFMSHT